MRQFQYQNVQLSYNFYAEYTAGGQKQQTAGDHTLSVTAETEPLGGYGFKTRLRLQNLSDRDILLHSAYPVCVQSIRLGETPPPQWMILNHGRHKNDLPSVCCAGMRNEAFDDAVNRLNEEGRLVRMDQSETVELNGDQIGILKTEDCSVAFCFYSAGTQMTEILIPVSAAGQIGTIRVGGAFDCLLAPGGSIYTEWAAVDCRADSLGVIDEYAKARAQLQHARTGAQKPGVYSTWYYYGKEVDAQDVQTNLHYIAEKKLPFSCFQIDAGWEQAYGDWEANEKFPQGMQAIAEQIQAHGMTAGIWTCPLIARQESKLFQMHPAWFLKHTNGTWCLFHMGAYDYCVLDCTNPEVLQWLEALYRKLAAWGYRHHKLDFTRAFPIQKNAVYHNPYRTPVQAYVDAMQAVRRGIGTDGYLLICGGLYDPLIGIADAQRTGSDVLSLWYDEHSGQPKIPFTTKQNVLRYFMNNWWHNDPDSLMVRRNWKAGKGKDLSMGTLTDDEAVTFTANQYFGGGLIGSTEPLDLIDDDRLYLLRHVMPAVPTRVKPLSLFSGERFVSLVDVWVEKGWHTICAVNWGDEPMQLKLTLDRTLVEEGRKYYAAAFFRKKVFKNVRCGHTVPIGLLPPHSTEIIKIADMNEPQIIRSDAHFSMGGEVDLQIADGMLLAEGFHHYPVPAHYTIALPDGRLFRMAVYKHGPFQKKFKLL